MRFMTASPSTAGHPHRRYVPPVPQGERASSVSLQSEVRSVKMSHPASKTPFFRSEKRPRQKGSVPDSPPRAILSDPPWADVLHRKGEPHDPAGGRTRRHRSPAERVSFTSPPAGGRSRKAAIRPCAFTMMDHRPSRSMRAEWREKARHAAPTGRTSAANSLPSSCTERRCPRWSARPRPLRPASCDIA